MRRFLASAWYPLLTALVFGGVMTAAFAILKPTNEAIYDENLLKYLQIGGWAAGGVIALLSFLLAGILNLIRRLFRCRRVNLFHPIVVLASIAPWTVMSWQVTGEPRYTKVAEIAIDFYARPMLWGALSAGLFAIIVALPLLIPTKKS
jgi:hypothetical protein